MQAELNQNGLGVPDIAGSEQGEQRLEYLRGSKADEGPNGNGYRIRASTLSDIVGSAPVFVGEPGFNYPNNLEASGETYAAFKTRVSGRTSMVYVGANDGMVHGFVASTTSGDKGQEKIAYVPEAVFPNLSRLTSSPYSHTATVPAPVCSATSSPPRRYSWASPGLTTPTAWRPAARRTRRSRPGS